MCRLLCFILFAAISATVAAESVIVPLPGSDPCFQDEVTDAASQLGNQPDIAALLADIQGHGKQCFVALTAGKNHTMRLANGRGSVIYWNPSSRNRYRDRVCHDPLSSLAHEIRHCRDEAAGTIKADRQKRVRVDSLSSAWIAVSIKQSEVNAAGTENSVRNFLGRCPRSTYGNGILPGATPSTRLPQCAPTECPPVTTRCDRVCCLVERLARLPEGRGDKSLITLALSDCRAAGNVEGYASSIQPEGACRPDTGLVAQRGVPRTASPARFPNDQGGSNDVVSSLDQEVEAQKR